MLTRANSVSVVNDRSGWGGAGRRQVGCRGETGPGLCEGKASEIKKKNQVIVTKFIEVHICFKNVQSVLLSDFEDDFSYILHTKHIIFV